MSTLDGVTSGRTDEEEVVEDVDVSFGIRSDILDPATVSSNLGLQPSRAFAKGEEYLGQELDLKSRRIVKCWRKRPVGIWAIDSRAFVHSDDVEQHLLYLLDMLEPKQDRLRYYLQHSEAYAVDFSISWRSASGEGGYRISSGVVHRASKLCHYMDFGCLYTGRRGGPDLEPLWRPDPEMTEEEKAS